jgi:SAM-dependent methyltransferase
MTDRWVSIRDVYDTVAVDYAQLVRVDGTEGTADLALLEDFAARVRGRGPVLDAGCGPGRITRHLADRGVDAFGVDLSPEMIHVARDLHPDLKFSIGNIDALDIESGSVAGVLAWYSIIHTSPEELSFVLAEFLRVLQPGGWLLTGHQSGIGTRHLSRAYGHEMDLTAHLYTAEHVADAIEELGGVVETRLTRDPQHSQRFPQSFVLARRP